MPRLIKYSTNQLKDVPDSALQVIEHTALFSLIQRNVSGSDNYKLMLFAASGAAYEFFIDDLKRKSVGNNPKSTLSSY